MEPQKTDQEQFDESVNRIGKVVLQVLAGVGIFAAVLMSLVALLNSGQTTTVRTIASGQPAAPVRATAPSSARIMIDHVLRGCHNLAVNGGAPDSPRATLHLAVGGRLLVQNNDVMPHRLFLRSGPSPTLATPMMNHMGAGSTVTFGKPGVYMLGTKPGEDYTKGIVTIGADHVLRIKVIVS